MATPPSGTAVLSAEAEKKPMTEFPCEEKEKVPGVGSKPVPLRVPVASTVKPLPAIDLTALARSKLNPPTLQKFEMLVSVKVQGDMKEAFMPSTEVKLPSAPATSSLPTELPVAELVFQAVTFVVAGGALFRAALPVNKMVPCRYAAEAELARPATKATAPRNLMNDFFMVLCG